jgi:DNA-binding MarR family transcriptional regulator
MNNDATPDRKISSADERNGDIHAAFQHLVSEVFRLNGQLLASADKLARELDLTPARWQAIAVVQREPVTVSEISRRLGIKRQSVQPTVNRLRDQGIVELKNNPDHRRAPLVELTPLGREIWGQLLARQQQLTMAFTGSLELTALDLERLTTELRALRRHAQNKD